MRVRPHGQVAQHGSSTRGSRSAPARLRQYCGRIHAWSTSTSAGPRSPTPGGIRAATRHGPRRPSRQPHLQRCSPTSHVTTRHRRGRAGLRQSSLSTTRRAPEFADALAAFIVTLASRNRTLRVTVSCTMVARHCSKVIQPAPVSLVLIGGVRAPGQGSCCPQRGGKTARHVPRHGRPGQSVLSAVNPGCSWTSYRPIASRALTN